MNLKAANSIRILSPQLKHTRHSTNFSIILLFHSWTNSNPTLKHKTKPSKYEIHFSFKNNFPASRKSFKVTAGALDKQPPRSGLLISTKKFYTKQKNLLFNEQNWKTDTILLQQICNKRDILPLSGTFPTLHDV